MPSLFAGVSAAGGLFVHQELTKRHVTLFALPFAGALVGALLGSAAIRLGWTRTSALASSSPRSGIDRDHEMQ